MSRTLRVCWTKRDSTYSATVKEKNMNKTGGVIEATRAKRQGQTVRD